jgi:hypothetical protein
MTLLNLQVALCLKANLFQNVEHKRQETHKYKYIRSSLAVKLLYLTRAFQFTN